ncbi:MAG: ABC transporter permease [Microbacterium sp.]|jgi:peptide/nickel transport system permease protein|nr:ABC transporter permease [Microbacterium sp.]
MIRRVLLAVAGIVLLVLVTMAVLPQVFTTADPLLADVGARLQPPSTDHPFGTDQSGRDVFARVVHGARASLGVGVTAVVVALLVGTVLGWLIGSAPKVVDALVMRVIDLALAVPEFLVALVVVALLGPGAGNVAVAVTIAVIPIYVRYSRGHTRALAAEEHVEAARMLGLPALTVSLRHVLPAVLRRLTVLATIGIGSTILAVAGLGFLGLGAGEPAPEWGLMLAGGRNVLARAWWVTLFPGLAITLTVVCASLIGRALRQRVEEGVR